MKFFKFSKEDQKNSQASEDTVITDATEETSEDEVSPVTKFKIIGALLLVGFSAGVAWWVQDSSNLPQNSGNLKTDILSASDNTQSTETVANVATQTGQNTVNNSATQENGFTQEVTISNFAFTPSQANIEKGQTVKWKNNDSVSHTVTGPDFTSPTLNSGDTFTYTFNEDATIEYHCSFHPQMKGTIIVGDGGAMAGLHAAAVENSEASQQSDITADISASNDSENVESKQSVFPAALEDIPVVNQNNIPNAGGNSLEGEPIGGNKESTVQPTPLNVKGGKLASSGPEDWLYVGLGGFMLYLNRKKLLAVVK